MRVALSLAGSAILLYSCDQTQSEEATSLDAVMTEYSDTLSVVMSQNGRRSYKFFAPQLEGYTLAREPYREFRRGIKVTTYHDDSLSTVNSVLTANYAIYYEKRKLWEAKGDVVVTRSDGKVLYTQQLFWNAQTRKIYSNVDTKLVDGTRSSTVGEGFVADEDFSDWRFRKGTMRMEVEFKPTQRADSTATADSPQSAGAPPVRPSVTADRPLPRPTRPAVTSRPTPSVERPATHQALPAEPQPRPFEPQKIEK